MEVGKMIYRREGIQSNNYRRTDRIEKSSFAGPGDGWWYVVQGTTIVMSWTGVGGMLVR